MITNMTNSSPVKASRRRRPRRCRRFVFDRNGVSVRRTAKFNGRERDVLGSGDGTSRVGRVRRRTISEMDSGVRGTETKTVRWKTGLNALGTNDNGEGMANDRE